MTAPVLTVVIPTYREAGNIGPLLQALQAEFAQHDVEYLIVDDDSKDGTVEEAQEACADVRTIVRTEERGLATAVVRGFHEARGDHVVVMDADFQHPPEAVRSLLETALQEEADLVVGSRYAPGGSESFGVVRKAISSGAALLAKLALPPVRRHRLSDPMTGLFLVRRDRIDLEELDPKGYKILLEIVAKSDLEKVVEVGYEFHSRREGESKLGAAVILQFLQHLLLLAIGHPDNRRVVRFGLVGLSGVAVNLSILWFLTDRVGLHYLASAAISVETSIVTNFLLNDRFTFHDRREGSLLSRLLKFNTVAITVLGLNLLTLALLKEIVGLHYLLAEGLAIIVSFSANYFGNIQWTYGGAKRFRMRRALRRAAPWLPFLIIVGASAGLYVHDLDRADEIYFDEHYYVSVAYQINDGKWHDPCWDGNGPAYRPLNFEHPPLAKLIIAWSVMRFDPDHDAFPGCRDPNGDGKQEYDNFTAELRESGNPYAWRMPSAVFGIMTVAFVGLAAGRLFGGPRVAAMASFLVAADTLVFTSARLAILDIFATGFVAVALYMATFTGRRAILATAFFLGLGFACKYTAVFAGPAVLLLLLWSHRKAGKLRRRVFDGSLLAFATIPLVLLVLSYLPWWVQWIPQMGFGAAVSHWWDMIAAGVSWGTSVQGDHPYALPPFEWLSMRRPTFYYAMWNAEGVEGLNRYIYAVGNPIVWWSGALVALGALVAAIRRLAGQMGSTKEQVDLLVAAGLPLITYGGFLVLDRESFLFYMTIVVPMLAVPLAGLLEQKWRGGSLAWRMAVPLFLLLVFASFMHFLPMAAAWNLTEQELHAITRVVPWLEPQGA